MRRAQLSFGDGLIAGEVSDLREGWMKHADQVLADEEIVAAVYEALAHRAWRVCSARAMPASICIPRSVCARARAREAAARRNRDEGLGRQWAQGPTLKGFVQFRGLCFLPAIHVDGHPQGRAGNALSNRCRVGKDL
jgi:hypothetical protein